MIDSSAPGSELVIPAGVWAFSHLVVAVPGLKLRGSPTGTILRHLDPTANAIVVRAGDVSLSDLRMEGCATAATSSCFAVMTEVEHPATRLRLERLQFTGPDQQRGFSSAIKLEQGADGAVVRGCNFERMWGTASGFGYAILCGRLTGALIENNTANAPRGRGRHFVYLSAGASDCRVLNNHSDGFDFEAMTIYATDAQTPGQRNRIQGNVIRSAARLGLVGIGAISVFGNARDNEIVGNTIAGSLGSGIVADGTGSGGLQRNHFIDNSIESSGCIGLDLISLQGGTVRGNRITESSLSSPGLHSNIRLVSDGQRPTRDISVTRNISTGPRFSRSAFQINPTPPLPIGIRLWDNQFARCRFTDVELSGLTV
jgi:hypothetical protein